MRQSVAGTCGESVTITTRTGLYAIMGIENQDAVNSGVTLVVQVSNTLRNAILGGKYHPGEKLPSEAKLTEAHGVSRTVVREAIAALRADGLVEPRRGAGVFV